MCVSLAKASALLHHLRGDYQGAVKSWLGMDNARAALEYIGR